MVSAILGKLNQHAIYNGDIKITTSDFPVESNYESIYDDEMDHLMEFFHSEHDEDILDVDLHMLQAWLVVAPPSKFYILSTVLFHKNGGANVGVTNFISHFSMLLPTKANVKLDNENTGNDQVIGIILCHFTNWPIIYPVGPIYYCPC